MLKLLTERGQEKIKTFGKPMLGAPEGLGFNCAQHPNLRNKHH